MSTTIDSVSRAELAGSSSLGGVVPVDTISALVNYAVTGGAKKSFFVRGRSSVGDGYGGFFDWDNTSTATVNGGTVFASLVITPTGRFLRRTTESEVNIGWFAPSGVTDDTALLTAALAVSPTVIVPSGLTVYIGANFTLQAGQTLQFKGTGAVKVDNARYLTINGRVVAGQRPIFLSSLGSGKTARVVFNLTHESGEVCANWYDIDAMTDVADFFNNFGTYMNAVVPASRVTLYFKKNDYPVGTNVNFSDLFTIRFHPGATFIVGVGVTCILNGKFHFDNVNNLGLNGGSGTLNLINFVRNVQSSATGINVDVACETVLIIASGQTFTMNLAAIRKGRRHTFKMKAVGTATIARSVGDTIDGAAANYTLSAQNKYVTLESDGGTDWSIVANN